MALTFDYEEVDHRVQFIKASWVSDSNGNATATTTKYYDGDLKGLCTIPGDSDGAPTDDYDITITDKYGIDVLMGAGINRDTANTEYVAYASLGAVSMSKLTFAVSATGELNSGVIAVYII